MEFNVIQIIFSGRIKPGIARTKLKKAGVEFIGRARRKRDGDLIFDIAADDDLYERTDEVVLSNDIRLIVQNNIPSGSNPIVVKLLFNISTSSANNWMSGLNIAKIGNGGGIKKGDYIYWTQYRIVKKGIGRNKKACQLGSKLACYIASKGI
jgi:hypothetical protein